MLARERSKAAEGKQKAEDRRGPGQFQFTDVVTLTEALAGLSQGRHDVMLLDLSLPDGTGREMFLRAQAAAHLGATSGGGCHKLAGE